MEKNLKKTVFFVIADDDTDDHHFVKEACQQSKIHYEIESVYNGLQLRELLLQKGAYKNIQRNIPDFILLDLNMPIMDGFAVLERLKENNLDSIPVYILTTSRSIEDKLRGKSAGVSGFYSKPVKAEELRRIIEEVTVKSLQFK
jgi:CheY-like chemotaxis protein